MKSRALLSAALLLMSGATASSAQTLEPVAQRIAAAWNKNDAAALTAFAAKPGISLELAGERVGPLPARQAAAALRSLFDKRETVTTRAGIAKEITGQPRRAFLELSWITRQPGTSETARSTVFVALVFEDGHWRVTEIRHMQ